jgi:hypothetical protein
MNHSARTVADDAQVIVIAVFMMADLRQPKKLRPKKAVCRATN